MLFRVLVPIFWLTLVHSACECPAGVHCYDPCSYWNGVCNGRCDIGFWGARCDNYCSEACATCNGGSAFDCLECAPNAYWDSRFGCKCYDGYHGSFCTMEKDYVCDPKCYGGCKGPTDNDCYSCVRNANKNIHGKCMCDPHYVEDDCSLYLEPGSYECDPHCSSCLGPSAKDCVDCVSNCSKDLHGYCACDAYWSGQDCSIYIGPCHPSCFNAGGCSGPTASDCVSCFNHASRDSAGNCTCDNYWTGSDCSRYIGPCDPKCYGCHGPTDSECVQCGEHSYSDVDGRCKCDGNWTGPQCRQYDGPCHSSCLGCRGPADTQCDYCVEHASWDGNGRCKCDYNWNGPECMMFTGHCHLLCNGCTGPTESDCNECASNAYESNNGKCICELYWTGPDCQKYIGACDLKCDGCHGPGASNCDSCVFHSQWDRDGYCQCDRTWSGDNCSIYDGLCDQKCDPAGGCKGALASDCNFCGENISRNSLGYCVCENNWTGDDCRIFIGECDPKCRGCSGPGPAACEQCVENAARDANGICSCESNWTGTSCESFSGNCHAHCLGCNGPNEWDCLDCVAHASWTDSAGQMVCECDPYWTGANCDEYFGLCDYKCHPDYPCYGPDPNNCFMCNTNAFENSMDECECKPEWSGSSCYTYVGFCDSLCLDGICSGSGPEHCSACVSNSHRDSMGRCICTKDYTGSDCSLYRGICDDKCHECHGPGSEHCVTCTANGEKNLDGVCECKAGWAGLRCEYWAGECSKQCDGCVGPTASDCKACIDNAYRDENGQCVCVDGWGGDYCESYAADCYHTCSDCTGPNKDQCTDCVANATRDSSGICTCLSEYSPIGCATYLGHCHSLCFGCTGPLVSQCIACRNNAVLDDTTCTCSDPWYGSTCNLWNGSCSATCDGCVNSEPSDCIQCVANAYWQDGTCVCHENYNSAPDCSEYNGTCDDLCLGGCVGPEHYHCISCVTNAHRDPVTGDCQCNEYYGGGDCSQYTGTCNCRCATCSGSGPDACLSCANFGTTVEEGCACTQDYNGECCERYTGTCAAACNSCTGPTAAQCTQCIVNAYWVDDTCTCHDDWSGTYCDVYEGDCPAICNGCFDAFNCTDCVANSIRTEVGHCKCLDGWAGDDCSTFSGRCDSLCDGCSNWGANNCISCVTNATKVDGVCTCDDGWFGDTCSTYIGTCYSTCLSCVGPGEDDCVTCVPNAVRQTEVGEWQGKCYCLPEYDDVTACSSYIGDCHPSCNSCTAPGPGYGACLQCVTHAYWNEYAECACDTCWNSNQSCTGYTCECDAKCVTCNGPGPDACIGCVTNASDVGGTCQCDSGYAGNNCSLYTGTCASLCAGCSGPLATDCISCIDYATRNTDGECVCEAGRTGDLCQTPGDKCHYTCLTCSGPEANECLTCHYGFYESSAECLACDSSCRTCSADGTCDTCHSNYALGLDSLCRRCHPSCEECTVGYEEAACSSCYFDAALDEATGTTCLCDVPLVRDPLTWKCVDRCLPGYTAVATYCTIDEGVGITASFDFNNELPQVTDPYEVTADSCRPPFRIDSRGGYWNGQNISVEITNFAPSQTAQIYMWAKAEVASVSLFAMFTKFWKSTEPYYSHSCDWDECDKDISSGLIDLWISPCNAWSITFKDQIGVADENSYAGGWAYVNYSWNMIVNSDQQIATEVELVVNGVDSLTLTSLYAVYPEWDPNFHIGSYRGNEFNLKGFVYDFYYNTDFTQDPPNFVECPANPCLVCTIGGTCLSDCNYNQFGETCTNCDPQCYQGCTEEGTDACYEAYYCHPNCKTCEGPGEDDCLTCFCEAHRSNESLEKSSCECNSDTAGASCELICTEGCDSCDGVDSNECLMCSVGYEFDEHSCRPCQSWGDCAAQGPKQIGGSCTCDNGQWYDLANFTCRTCPPNCAQWEDTGYCNSCADGYFLAGSTGTCIDVCPTGTYESETGDCAQVNMVIAEFTFVPGDHVSSSWADWRHYTDYSQQWEVLAYTGSSPNQYSNQDPYLSDDRGLYFDGKNDYVSLEGLMLNSSFTFALWVKPHGSGTLFTSADKNGPGYYSFGISGYRLKFNDGFHDDTWLSTIEPVDLFLWQNLAVTFEWNAGSVDEVDSSIIGAANNASYTKNGAQISTYTFNYIFQDRPDFDYHHLLGANESMGSLSQYYTGYIYNIRVTNFAVTNFDDYILEDETCGIECDVCPAAETCLSSCNWNAYWNGYKCVRCPSWCNLGCQTNGTC